MSKPSTEFGWKEEDFQLLLDTCKYDEEVQIAKRHIELHGGQEQNILELGAGLGRIVKYFKDEGYQNIHGIELNGTAVKYLNEKYPELDVIQGDVLSLPYPPASFDVVLSYGLVEHFIPGLATPLKAHFDALKPGSIAVITVPSMNFMRRFVNRCGKISTIIDPRKNVLVRKLLKKPDFAKRNAGGKFQYYVHPPYGDFFEYRLTPREYETACKTAGFTILESTPIMHPDGLYHLIGSRLGIIRHENHRFVVSLLGKIIIATSKRIRFFNNHMHLVVVQKPFTS
ncbi:MAG: methyltransferase domain-containing protein [Patescibacteria group bacterium]